jgi:sporulation protein YlmC with PRC-barrel domain
MAYAIDSQQEIHSMRTHTHRNTLSASTLAGDPVVNSRGESLGKIEDLMIDLDSGRVAYAVLGFGGFLGIGNKFFAVPWQALRVDQDSHNIVFDIDKERLEDAPGFEKDNWPDMSDLTWRNEIYQYYNVKPYWT